MIEKGKPDILHIHWQHPFLLSSTKLKTILKSTIFILEIILLKLMGIKIIWTVHNIVNHEKIFSNIELFFGKILAKLCDKLIVHCPYAKKEVIRVFNITSSTVCVIPHGNYNYENRIDKSKAREILNLNESDKVLLYFGQIRPYKGVDNLIKAFKEINAKGIKLLIAGKPFNRQIATEIIEASKNNENIIIIFKFVPDNEIQIYMNASDIMVLPYKDILTSGAVMLAMSFGKFIITPAIGCNLDILNGTGNVLYDPNYEKALTVAIQKAIDIPSKDLIKIGRHNYKASKRYCWIWIAKRTYELYMEIVRRPND